MTSPTATGTKAAPSLRASRKTRQGLSLGLGLASLAAMGILPATSGCLNRPIEPVEPRTTSTVIEKITQSGVDKIDIVLMIDNSSSMADKQEILAAAVPELVDRLVNPQCVDPMGVPAPSQPTTPAAMCAAGYKREFKPINDINIGIVDSSLGGMGSDACPDSLAGYYNNDKGHLVSRSAANTPTYMSQGFLAWDGMSARGGISDSATLKSNLQALVKGVGEKGCGYEQQLEGVTRFLVVPKPYDSLQKGSGGGIPAVTPMGEDTELEKERAAFLRPDSLLAVILLTDENDFSINYLGGQNYAPWNSSPFYRGSSICQTNPGDKCCYSCGLGPPSGCTADPICSSNPQLSAQEDSVNLKESQPKKKYGFDPNFPVKRYVNAFSQLTIDPTHADLSVTDTKKAVPNPIFTDLSGQGRAARDPSLVFFAAIVGVPYQAVARDPNDLSKGFKNFDELSATPSGPGSDFFTQYVGDPDNYVPPQNPIMQESTAKRGVMAGAPNGGDRNLNTTTPNDIQYTCVFPLATPNPTGIDCQTPDSVDNPLCTGGAQGQAKEPQINAKAYPGIRELAVVHGLAGQGIAASICPQNVNDPTKANFGYNPAVGSIIERLKTKLGGQCLPRQLHADGNGNVPCIVIEASHLANGQSNCQSPPGRQPVQAGHEGAVAAAKADPTAPPSPNEWNNFCEIVQLPGLSSDTTSPKYICQNTLDANLPSSGLDGWCYIDAASVPPVGNKDIVASCPPNDQRLVRFVGSGAVQTGATALITCSGDTAQ